MPVTSPHPQYSQHAPAWEECRDAAEGSKPIKAKGTRYLPQLSAQEDKEYQAYKLRALWYGATGRTIQGLLGAVFRKAPTTEVPDGVLPHLKDITLTGVTFEGFCKAALEEILKVGRYGVLVDMGKDDAAQQRPYWVGYKAEKIVNWSTTQVQGDTVLTMVVLYEDRVVPDPADLFAYKTEPQYRVLRLLDQHYVVELYRQQGTDSKTWVVAETLTPTFRGSALTFIPFCFLGPNTVTTDVEKPPLQDLVEVNLSHYRSSADLEHGRHYCGLPTPWVAGFPVETVLRIGSSIAWVSNDPSARVGMLEFTGQGLGALVTACESKERLMAILGARMLEEQKKAVESADTHGLRMSGEHSVLASLAGTVEAAMKRALMWHTMWAGLDDKTVEAELNKEFYESRMDPSELAELLKSWQSGAIDHATLYWNMERGGLTRPGVTFEDEKTAIDSQPPARIALADSNPEDPFS